MMIITDNEIYDHIHNTLKKVDLVKKKVCSSDNSRLVKS